MYICVRKSKPTAHYRNVEYVDNGIIQPSNLKNSNVQNKNSSAKFKHMFLHPEDLMAYTW